MYSLLIVDDEENMLWSLDRALRNKNYEITCLDNPFDALDLCQKSSFDLILSDQRMPNLEGVELLTKISKLLPKSKRILISAYTDFYDVVEAFNDGIINKFITKPWDNDTLRKLVKEQLKSSEEKQTTISSIDIHPSKSKAESPAIVIFHNILTASSPVIKQIEFIKTVANSNAAFFIHGETGTGKELFAHAIHLESNRSKFPFVAVNCANLSETLLESQLFGHKKGAFTGATKDQEGLFSSAEGGTLFLDEITEIPLDMQAKLLRVIQEKEFTPLGETKPIPFNIQIVSASSTSLSDAVNSGNFRSDLRFRLDIMPITLPPLRERKEDIIPLLEHFLEKEMINQNVLIKDVDSEVLHFLISYSWPGNIRELVNLCIYLVAVAPAYEHNISMASLPDTMLKPSTPNAAIQKSLQKGFIERRSTANNTATTTPAAKKVNTQLITLDMIQQALTNNNGNKSLAAKELGISRMTLYRKIQESQESKDPR